MDYDTAVAFREKVSKCWSKDTSFKGTEGSRGQCYCTALLASQVLGGYIVAGWVKTPKGGREHHFWNVIEGFDYDFTSDQYGGDGIHPIIKGEYFDKPNYNNPKYIKLKNKYRELIG